MKERPRGEQRWGGRGGCGDVTHISGVAGLVVSELELVERDVLLHPVLPRVRRVRVHVHASVCS